MTSKRELLDSLRRVPLFAGCTSADLGRILRLGKEIEAAPGQVLITQGAVDLKAFVILNGSATVRRNGKKVASLGPGSVVGELSLLDYGPRTATVTCDSECTLLVLTKRQFLGLLDSTPSLARKLLESLAGKIREFDRQYFG
jgi:CRP-like cAMP-binding protein